MIFCSPENVDELKSESNEENISVQTKVFGVKTVYIWEHSTVSNLNETSDFLSFLSAVILFFRFI